MKGISDICHPILFWLSYPFVYSIPAETKEFLYLYKSNYILPLLFHIVAIRSRTWIIKIRRIWFLYLIGVLCRRHEYFIYTIYTKHDGWRKPGLAPERPTIIRRMLQDFSQTDWKFLHGKNYQCTFSPFYLTKKTTLVGL